MIENRFLLEDILSSTQGEVLQSGESQFTGVSTNSKDRQTGAIFIPLKGERFDAHDFILEAIANGAKLILSEKKMQVPEGVGLIQVIDTLNALQSFAAYWRKKNKAKVLAITGSNGKTTTKEFLRQVLESKYRLCYSEGSFNNHWGVPLSLLKLKPADEVMISEMGMNHIGEIATLCGIAKPDITLVTNVGRAHIEHMKSLENIAQEKEQIYATSKDAIKVFNLDNPYTCKMLETYKNSSKVFTFSVRNTDADVYLEKSKDQVKGHIGGKSGEADFHVFGEQNLENLAAAISMALAFGMPAEDIWSSIHRCKTIWGRNQWVDLASGAKAVFDAYNANPESMAALLKNIAAMGEASGKKYLVVGDMLELGEKNDAEHIALAKSISEIDFEKVYFIGKNAAIFKTNYSKKNLVVSNTYQEELAFKLESMLDNNDIVFFKASRGIRLEKFLNDMKPLNFTSK